MFKEVFSRGLFTFKFTNVLKGLSPTFIYREIFMNSLFLQNNVSQKVSKEELEVTKGILLAEINKKPSQTDLEALKVSSSKTISFLSFSIFLNRKTVLRS